MTGTLQPLDSKFAIVDSQGRPTEYFTRWAQQKQIDIGTSITLEDLLNFLKGNVTIGGDLTVNGVGSTFAGSLDFQPPTDTYTNLGFFSQNHTLRAFFFGGTNGDPAFYIDAEKIVLENLAENIQYLTADATGLVAAGGKKVYTEGNLSFGAGLTYVGGVLAASGGGGGPTYEASPTKPVAASFTLVNGGTGTLTDTALGVAVLFPVGATDTLHLAQWNTAVASTTFTVTVRLRPTLLTPNGNHYQSCLIIRNSTNDRQVVFGDFSGNSQTLVQNWTTNAVFSGNVVGPVGCATAAFPWRRVVCTAGTMSFEASPDGVTWMSIGTATLASFLTAAGGAADKVGVGARGVGGDVCYSLTLV